MAWARFDDTGYIYYNEKTSKIFCTDSTHADLFDYVAEDLSLLTKLLEKYVSNKIDTATFTFKDFPSTDDTLSEIEQLLMAAHPYYIYESTNVIINAIGNYFNNLLAYSSLHLKTPSRDCTLDKNWYIDRITVLLSPLLQAGDTYQEDFYYKYQKWINPKEYRIEESFITDIPTKMPIAFAEELKTQNMIYDMLYFILDISNQNLESLTLPQRAWVYENIFLSEKTSVKRQFSFLPLKQYIDDATNSQISFSHNEGANNLEESNKIFGILRNIKNTDIRHKGIPQNMMNAFKYATDYAKKNAPDKISEQYEINNLYQLLYLEIISMIQSNILIRKCKNCGKYFLIKNRNVTYCDRRDSSDMPCSAIGPKRSFQKKMEQDEALKIYTRAYKTHHARFRKGKMSLNEFGTWCKEAKANLIKARNEELDISVFQEWLKE